MKIFLELDNDEVGMEYVPHIKSKEEAVLALQLLRAAYSATQVLNEALEEKEFE